MKNNQIALSILSANFACLGADIKRALIAGGDIIHFDVMDGHYVSNLTIGSMVLQSLREYGITEPIDVHFMVCHIDRLIPNFAKAGASSIIFHIEASKNVKQTLKIIKENGCKAGLAFSPKISLNDLDCFIDEIDSVLILLVNPGFSGQSLISTMLNKLSIARKIIDKSSSNILLEADGGIKTENIAEVASYGNPDVFVIGSAIFNQPDYTKIISNIRNELAQLD